MRLEKFAGLLLVARGVPNCAQKKLALRKAKVSTDGSSHPAQRSSMSLSPVGGAFWAAMIGTLVVVLSGCSSIHPSLQVNEIAPGVFDGRKPNTEADFQALRAKNIRTIVSLQTLTCDIEPERKRAIKNGFQYINVPILASPLGPREEKVRKLFETLATPSVRPVYVHCLLGRDRTGVLMALYRVYYENIAPQEAWDEMIHRGGFRSHWALIGFRVYYWNHCERPDWVKPSVNSLRAALPTN